MSTVQTVSEKLAAGVVCEGGLAGCTVRDKAFDISSYLVGKMWSSCPSLYSCSCARAVAPEPTIWANYVGFSTIIDNPGFPEGILLKNGIVRMFSGVDPSASSFLRARSVWRVKL